VYDQHELTAAHRTLALGSRVEVTDVATGRRVQVRINDRGPYHAGRVLDLSYGAAKQLQIVGRGVVDVEIRVLNAGSATSAYVTYAVQLGVFRNRAEAERIARSAQSAGAFPRVLTAPGEPPRYHVRVGPYDDRSKAAAAARTLRDLGFDAVVVEQAPRASQPARAAWVPHSASPHELSAQAR
jgi:rare lipoprotein A